MQPSLFTEKRKSVLLIVFASTGIAGLLVRGVVLVVQGITSFSPSSSQAASDLADSVLGALSMLFCALLLVPLIYYSLRALRGQAFPALMVRPVRFWQASALVTAWLGIVLFGSILVGYSDYGWAWVAPFFPFGLALPIALILWIAIGGLPTASLRRVWAIFSLGMAGSTVLALIGEYLVIGSAGLVAGVALLAHPEWRAVVTGLRTQIAHAGDMQAVINLLTPYLTNPLVILLILAFAAGIGPLIEEAAKPAALWLLGKRLHSPAEGFALGALCGAGFSLLEGLLAASGVSQMWGIGMAGRAASSLMHITASGIMGWGIASARAERRYARLAGSYLVAVGFHGLWNGSVVLTVYGALRISLQKAMPDLPSLLLILAGLGLLGGLLVAALIVLPLANRALRQAPSAPASPALQTDV